MNVNAKHELQLVNWIQQYTKKKNTSWLICISLRNARLCNFGKAIHVIHHIIRKKKTEKNGMIITEMQRKYLVKSTFIHNKTLSKIEIKWNFLNLTKGAYDNFIANVTSHVKTLRALILKFGTREEFLQLLLLFNLVLEALASSVKQ